MAPKSTNHFRVGLAIDTATTWGESLIHGIHSYAAEQGGWKLDIAPRGRYESPHWETRGKPFDGILARVTTLERARYVRQFKVPVVSVSSHDPTGGELYRCGTSMFAFGKLAAEHFLERGYREFGYVSTSEPRDNHTDEQQRGFAHTLAQEGYALRVFNPLEKKKHRSPKAQDERLQHWLQQLPLPAALLVWNSWEARRTCDACQAAVIAIPEQIAILAGEHDELFCTMNHPPLSSIDPAGDIVGWQAAQLLHRLMRGEDPPKEPILIEPRGIFERASTDIMAIEDEIVTQALTYIRAYALRGISVIDVVAQVPLSRRGLEVRFREVLGRSPAEEIRYVRVEHARAMLLSTKFSLKRIARAAAFGDEDLLSRAFRHFYHETPAQYRRRLGFGSR